jgi:hypothetical protein
VEARDLAAVDEIGVKRIGREVRILVATDWMPVAERDVAVAAAVRDADRAALLLAPNTRYGNASSQITW